MTNTTIVEINGIKMELDHRTAQVQSIDTFKVGDKVDVLTKAEYGEGKKVYRGAIVGFANFASDPTVVIAYITDGYSPELKIAHVNKSSSVEFVRADDRADYLERQYILNAFDWEIQKKENEIADIRAKRNYFVERFGAYFKQEAEAHA